MRASRNQAPEHVGECHLAKASEVENLVWREVSSHLSDPDWLLELAGLNDDGGADDDAERRQTRMAQLLREERELERLKVDAFAKGLKAGMSAAEIERTVDQFSTEQTAKQDEREMLEQLGAGTEVRDERKRRLLGLAKAAFMWMSDPSFQKQVYEDLDVRVIIEDYKPLRVRVEGRILEPAMCSPEAR